MRGLACMVIGTVMMVGATAVAAQDVGGNAVPPGWSVRHVRIEGRERSDRDAPAPRTLTVRPRLSPAPDDADDPLFSGGTHYGSVATFSPFPSVDSGTQLPYGLDGIGGYGSDYGTTAGNSVEAYDRGP